MASQAASLVALFVLAGPSSTDDLDRTQLSQKDSTQAGYDASAFAPIDADIIGSEGYLAAHPDQKFRLLGNDARRNGRLSEAREYFSRAARYADKLSQGAIAEMYWNGEGVPRNRPLAYAWMDLAAERGAQLLLAHRESYWSQMTPAERQQAIHEGEQLYAEYGDAVAKPRLERKLIVARRNVTGSHVGWIGNLSVCVDPSVGSCGAAVTGEQYYADRYWIPKKYWEWQDQIILTPGRTGEVKVGPVEPVREQTSDGNK